MADILTVNHRLLKSLLLYATIFFASREVGRGKQKERGGPIIEVRRQSNKYGT